MSRLLRGGRPAVSRRLGKLQLTVWRDYRGENDRRGEDSTVAL